jgi:hypothetical protein
MASSLTWNTYHNKGVIETDEEVLSMVRDVCETIHCLERMYGTDRAQLTVRALLLDWQALSGIASVRGLHYEHP